MAQAQASTAKKSTPAKKEGSKSLNVEKVTETAKDTAMVGLGVVGKLVDGVQSRVEDVRKEAPKTWGDFVKRGEQLKDAANDKVNGVNFSFKYSMKEQRAQFNEVVDAVRTFVKPSKP